VCRHIVGYRVWNNLMKTYPASVLAPLSLMVPVPVPVPVSVSVSGLFIAYWFFGEQLRGEQGIAIGLVFVGIAIFVNSAGIMVRLGR
jgi:O-acetylserine/cysteine efflux transporter